MNTENHLSSPLSLDGDTDLSLDGNTVPVGASAYSGAAAGASGTGTGAVPGGPAMAMGGSAGAPPGGVPPGGAWVWTPQGVESKKPWRKRHPVIFWGGVILLLLLVFAWGRLSGEDSPVTGPRIAVINVDGLIMDAGDVVAWIEKVRREPSYKGAVVRINSPGGAVGPSQEIYAAVKRLAAAKPVVASMGSLAASGGYYAALGANEIIAGPSTLTASIGVKMQLPNIEGLMRTIGISEKTLTTGKLKDAGSSWREMTPEEEAYFRGILTDMYEEFIKTVAEERGLSLEKVRELADGRAMTGRQALEAKLVDTLGDMHLAVQKVRERCKLAPDEAKLVQGPEKPQSWLADLLSSSLENVLQRRATAEQPVFLY